MPAPLNNQNAVKDKAELASSFLHIRCTRREKSAWVRRANQQKLKLAEWTKQTLNHASKP